MEVANATARLVAQLCPPSLPASSTAGASSTEPTPTSLLQLALRILSSDFAVLGRGDLFHVSRSVRRTLINSTPGRDVAKSGAVEFETLARRLESSKTMRHAWSAVYLLHALSRRRHAGMMVGGHVGASLAAMRLPHAAIGGGGALFGAARTGVGASLSQGATAVDRGSVAAQARQHAPKPVGRVAAAAPFAPAGAVSEQLLIRDVVFVLQGIEGTYVGLSADASGFAVRDAVQCSVATRQLVRKLCEAGWLYKRLTAFIECFESSVHAGQGASGASARRGAGGSSSSSSSSGGSGSGGGDAIALAPRATRSGGLVRQALCQALRNELCEYYKVVAVLQAQVDAYQRALADEQLADARGPSASSARLSHLTLRRLLVWTAEPVERLRVLVSIAEASATAHGGFSLFTVTFHANHAHNLTRSP